MAPINTAKYSNMPAGIYREIIDQAEQPSLPFNQGRLLVGFSRKGIFNRVVRVDNRSQARQLFGNKDRYLEKRGSFFHRSLEIALEQGPVYALNLRKLNPEDQIDLVDGFALSARYDQDSSGEDTQVELKKLYNTNKYWTPDATKLVDEVEDSNNNLIKFANTRQGTLTVFAVKADAPALDVPATEWYGGADKVPGWMDDNPLISDFQVRLVVVRGSFGAENYEALSNDSVFGNYFDYDDTSAEKSGLKEEKLNEFLNLNQVEVVEDLEGSLIPGLRDQNGEDIYVGDRINQQVDTTGLLFHIDEDQFEDQANVNPVNLIGEAGLSTGAEVLSYTVDDLSTLGESLPLYDGTIDGENVSNTGTEFYVEYSGLPDAWTEGESYGVGDIVDYDGVYYEAKSSHESAVGNAPGEGEEWEVYMGTVDPTPRIQKGDYVKSADGNGGLVRVTSVNLAAPGEHVSKVETDGAVDVSGTNVEKFEPIHKGVTHIQGFAAAGFELTSAHVPNGSWSDIETKVLSVLHTTNIGNAISNRDSNEFRYLVDTFSGGIASGSKSELTTLCADKQNMFAILNAPSMDEFTSSTNPSFLDATGNLSTELITQGGKEGSGTFTYALPGEQDGAYFGGFFGPHLTFRDGNKEVTVPPAALVSNYFVQKHRTAQGWTIVAGNDWTLSASGLVGVEYDLDGDDRQAFEEFGINPIVSKRGQGLTIEGNLTAKQTPKSPLSSINGIEVVIEIQDRIEAMLQNHQWDWNDEPTRLEIKNRADDICNSVQSAGGIYDYENIMDRSNNTDEVINAEIGVLNTYIEIARGMKIIVNPLTVSRTGSIAAGGVTTL